jgi:hypothetical protein
MNSIYFIIKKIAVVFVVLFVSAVVQRAVAQESFPFFRSFLDGNIDGIRKMEAGEGDLERKNSMELTDDGLQLTSLRSQVGSFYLPKHTFTTEDGMLIEFEYMMYGSTDLTDGICMFLVDASPQYTGDNLKFGAEGAGFGYTHNWSIDLYKGRRRAGIKGAYLGISLDQGNFKSIRFQGEELRDGIPYKSVGSEPARDIIGKKPEAHDLRSNVSIRGAAGRGIKDIVVQGSNINGTSFNEKYTMQEGYWGYPTLITRHTGGNSDPNALRNEAGYKLETSNGTYVQETTHKIPTPFNIAGGGTFTDPSQPEYRKVIIALDVNSNEVEGGFKITVTIQHGEAKTVVIDRFTYPNKLLYQASGLPLFIANNYPQPDVDPTLVELNVARPEKLVIGFGASTGTDTDYANVIKNLRITPLYGANTVNDDIHDHRRGPVTVHPLDNDIGYNKDEAGSVIGDKDFLDPYSFRFWPDEKEPLLNNEGKAVFEYEDIGKGKWVYTPSNRQVLFFPQKGFTGQTEIFYDIKGQYAPFNDEKFRSSLAAISVIIEDNQPTK